MATLIMMASPLVYKLVYDQAVTYEFRPDTPVPMFEKPLYHNKYNKPLNELLDNDGNPIDPTKYNIVTPTPYTDDAKEKAIYTMGKNWFVQWCEIASYYEDERKKHINDDIWQKMAGTPPGPTPPNGPQGTPAAEYALTNSFRIMPTPLLTDKNWYILWDVATLEDE